MMLGTNPVGYILCSLCVFDLRRHNLRVLSDAVYSNISETRLPRIHFSYTPTPYSSFKCPVT
jgi:hypothetical protein